MPRLSDAEFALTWNACRTAAEVSERTGLRAAASKACDLRKAGWDLRYYRSPSRSTREDFVAAVASAPTMAAAGVLLGMTADQCSSRAAHLRRIGVAVPRKAGGTLAEVLERGTRVGPGCWAWAGRTDSDGVGTVCLAGGTRHTRRVITARKAAYLAYVGPIPAGASVVPKCANIFCVRPDHLEAVRHSAESRKSRQALGLGPAMPKTHPLTCSGCGSPFFGERRQKKRAELGKPVSCGCRRGRHCAGPRGTLRERVEAARMAEAEEVTAPR